MGQRQIGYTSKAMCPEEVIKVLRANLEEANVKVTIAEDSYRCLRNDMADKYNKQMSELRKDVQAEKQFSKRLFRLVAYMIRENYTPEEIASLSKLATQNQRERT